MVFAGTLGPVSFCAEVLGRSVPFPVAFVTFPGVGAVPLFDALVAFFTGGVVAFVVFFTGVVVFVTLGVPVI